MLTIKVFLGDWSIFQPDDHVTTILEGIQAAASPEQSILYSNSGRIKAKKSELSVNTTDPAIQKKLITEGGGISDYSIDDAVRKGPAVRFGNCCNWRIWNTFGMGIKNLWRIGGPSFNRFLRTTVGTGSSNTCHWYSRSYRHCKWQTSK